MENLYKSLVFDAQDDFQSILDICHLVWELSERNRDIPQAYIVARCSFPTASWDLINDGTIQLHELNEIANLILPELWAVTGPQHKHHAFV